MAHKALWELKIDPEFKDLIRPLYKQEYMLLEENLKQDGCREPLTTWNGFIIDGHNRYEICTRLQIPFSYEEKEFESRDEVISWICTNQLGRRNLTEETRKFLIGRLYESEKIVNAKKNVKGKNQHTKKETPYERFEPDPPAQDALSNKKTAQKIAASNHISHGTVEKYAAYTRALEVIGKKVPELVPKILSGKYKVSHNAIVELSKWPEDEIRDVNNRLEMTKQPFAQYQTTRNEIMRAPRPKKVNLTDKTKSVKDMPAFDPDAEITGLTLTVPSWISSIKRTMSETNPKAISSEARAQMMNTLFDLETVITEMLIFIEEVK